MRSLNHVSELPNVQPTTHMEGGSADTAECVAKRSKLLQLWCFWGTDPAPVCVGSGIFMLFLPAQCKYAKCELMMKGIVWKSSL